MFNYKIFQRQVVQQSSPEQGSKRVTRQQNLTSLSIIISIENDRLIIRADVNNNFLVNPDWSIKRVTVTEAKNVGFLYEFREIKSAFAFLDALLLHHIIKMSETRVESAALVPLAALAG
jgi:ribosome biogenesis protein Nip4